MWKALWRPIDSAILTYFRFCTGLLFSQELINIIFLGKLKHYENVQFHFSYLFTPWITPLPSYGVLTILLITILSGWAVAINFHYRLFSILLFLGYLSYFLMFPVDYINHIYLYTLISFWMIFLPLNKLQTKQPAWILYFLLFHMVIVYFFAGIAKINPDWLSGRPMDIYLKNNLGINNQAIAIAMSIAGLLFDLFISLFLIIKRTRKWAFGVAVLFHLSNVFIFGLATFPWFSILMSSMFFDPSWPRKLPFFPQSEFSETTAQVNPRLLICALLYSLVQFLLPLRVHLYPGNNSWSEEGHMFSWRMMLRNKQGSIAFYVQTQNSNDKIKVNLNEFLSDYQIRRMIGKPDFILEFSQFIKKYYKDNFNLDVRVYASSIISLNGRAPKEMVSTHIDLGSKERSLRSYSWVLQ